MLTLSESPLFRGISGTEAEKLLVCLSARQAEYKRGAMLLCAGTPSADMALVLVGRVDIVQDDFWGNRNLVRVCAPGALFGEAYACTGDQKLYVSVIAQTDTAVLWLNAQRVLTTCPDTCGCHSVLIRNLLKQLAFNNIRMSRKMEHITQRTTRDKLLSYLSAQAQEHGRAEFDIPLSRQQLADYLSVERSAMSAELSRLRRDGLIESDRTHFILRNTEADQRAFVNRQ